MAQKPQIIDITRSYIPGDPNAFPENLVGTQREDGEEKAPPISIFEGYNFLPTSYGYKSYFGTSSALDVPVVPARAQFILSYQSSGYINNLIALCEDGIWIIDPTADTNVWKHVVVHTFDADVFEEWTWCIIENAIYCYKQGGASVYHTSDVDDVPNGLSISIITEVPTFLNMAGQMGIFKAGTRLGFWDSANSVAWSSNLVLTDFTPSLENLAGNTIFGAVIGRITHVREHGEGFVVYSTKSIVGVSYDATSNLLWDAHTITAGCGVAVGREVTMGSSNSEHFAYTTSGMYRIGGYNGTAKQYEFQQVAVELSDFLKESREPVYLDCIEGRYLYIHCINSDYINGKVSFESFTVDLITIDIIPDILPSKIPSGLFIKKMQKIERDTMDQTYGDTLVKYSADGVAFDVVEWEVSYKTISPLGLAEKYEEPSVGASFAYADAGTLDRTSTGGADRTATAGVFVDAAGKYGSLEQTIVLPTLADFTVRGTSAEDDFAPKVSGLLLYQDDALGGTLSPSYLLQKALPVEPSYLPLVGASSLGMIEGLYNVESLWKDFEKRQGAAVDRFTEIVDGLEDQSWSAYSTSGALEATIETPILSIFDLYKPRGCVGVQKQGKGFFFYKQYREIFDCTITSTRTMEALTEHKMVGESSYTTGVTKALEDSVEVTINVISGGEAAFPNPSNYPLIATEHAGAYTYNIGTVDGYVLQIYYAVVDEVTGTKSGKKFLQWLSDDTYLTIAPSSNLPSGYRYRLYAFYDSLLNLGGGSYSIGVVNKYTDRVITVEAELTIDSWAAFESDISSYPEATEDTTGNEFVEAPVASNFTLGAIVSGPEHVDIYLYTEKSGTERLFSPLVFLGSSDIDYGKSISITSPAVTTGYAYSALVHYVASGVNAYYYKNLVAGGTAISVPSIEWADTFSYGLSGTHWRYVNPITWATSSPGVPTDYTTIVTSADPHSPTFLRDLQVDSEINPIYFSVPDVYITLRPYDYYNQLLTTPWSAAGTTVVQSYSEQLPGSDISAVLKPLQTLTLPGDYVIAQPEAAVQFKVQKESAETHEEYPYLMSPMGSAGDEAFPNPGAYPITVSITVGGSWAISDEYATQCIYCIADSVTGEVSEYIRSGIVSNTTKINITIPAESALYDNYVHRIIIVYDQLYHEGGPLPEITRRFYYKDFSTPGSYVINSAAETTESLIYPSSSINTDNNVHTEALSSVGWSISTNPVSSGHWYIGTTDFWIATVQNGALSEPTFIGSFATDGSTYPKVSGPLISTLLGTTYIYINHPDDPDPPTFPYYGRYIQRHLVVADMGGFASFNSISPGFVYATCAQFPDYSIKNVSTWATSSPPTTGDLLAYYQSFEQSYLALSNYARYLQAILAFDLTPTGKQIRPSLDMAEYRIVNAGEYLELWCDDIVEAFNPHPVSAVLALLHQNSGFIYQYDVDEQLYGSIIDNQTVELTGAALVPTLDTEGVYNTLGGFFSPKNKISCTMTAGVLTQGAVTAIDDYTANEAEILDFLQPANELFLTDKYLLPPTYDEGERWYLVESADVIYETGTPFHHKEGLISSITTPVWSTLLYLPDYAPYDIPADDAVVIIGEDSATLPGATFNLQVGAPAPSYPTFTGAYVFDLHLKKWGKMKASYKHIFPFAPLNSNASGAISFTNFGMDCGVVLSTGVISLFDVAPADSYIRFGKLGYYRLGMTNLLEVKGMFRGVFEGSVITDTSLDGRTLSIPLRHIEDFSNVLNVTAYPDVSGRWHTIKISGNYDLQYLELRGTIAGRR